MRRVVKAEEQDAYTRWRYVLAYLGKPGRVKAIKQRTHRRERREAQAEIREWRDDR